MSKTPFFITIARPTYGAYLLRHHGIQTNGMEILNQLEAPYLVLGNHSHVFDPFFISAAANVHIRWVSGAYLFKLHGLKTMLGKWIGGIPKQQGRSDLQTIRLISEAFKRGEIVGLFPEGTRTWDGEPVGFDEATAKLAKIFKVPIVVVNLEGVYALKPRWANKRRKGTATIHVLPPLMSETIASMKRSQINAYLKQAINFSHREWQEKHHQSFKGKAQSEGIERVLYTCPSCLHHSTIEAKKDLISCTHCGLTIRLDEYDHLINIKGENPFQDVAQWHAWERKNLEQIMQVSNDGQNIFPPDKGVLYQIGIDNNLVTLSKSFALTVNQKGMTLRKTGKFRAPEITFFSFDTMQSMIINAKSTLEFYCADVLYRIRIYKNGSILKYVESYQASRQAQRSEEVHT